jgi:hypothetical protein
MDPDSVNLDFWQIVLLLIKKRRLYGQLLAKDVFSIMTLLIKLILQRL